jgi:hypothetical protein
MVTSPDLTIPIGSSSDIIPAYYRVSVVNHSGVESTLSIDSLKTPDIFAFAPLFKGVYWVSPNETLTQEATGSWEAPFPTLSEAIARVGRPATFLVTQRRDQITSSLNLSSEATVYYADDLSALEGRVEVAIPTGIDEDATMQLLLLCKLIPKNPIRVKVVLQGAPGVKLEERKGKLPDNRHPKRETSPSNDQKTLLTPVKVSTHLGQNTIYLVWDRPQSPTYKGVRIFRSNERGIDDFTKVGPQIYEGTGDPGELYCWPTSRYRPLSQQKMVDYLQPPPRVNERARPKPPSNLRVHRQYEVTDSQSSYFGDTTVSPNMIYTYTLWTYDDKNTYGHPITIKAYLSDASSKKSWDYCYQKTWFDGE